MTKKSNDCIFCGISEGKIDSVIKYADNKALAFCDINPQAPVHILVIPRRHIVSLNKAGTDILGHLLSIARRLAREEGLSEKGYRVVINCGDMGGQEVNHLHVHVLGGRQMKWPPG